MSQNNKATTTTSILVVISAVIIGFTIGVSYSKFVSRTSQQPRGQDKLSYTMDLVQQTYVDPISRDSLAEKLLPELFLKLDPHSAYIPKSEFAASNEPLEGKFDGIGVMFNMLTDTAMISTVISGGPSHRAGVVAGDRIMTVNDSLVAGVKLESNQLVKKLRGPSGTRVTIGVLRNGSKTLVKIPITRGVIPMKSLEASFLIDKTVGFIKFSRFAATTYEEITESMKSLTDDGAKSFIIDMRGNSGGYLDQAIYIANMFLDKGQTIVYTQGTHARRSEQKADGSGEYRKTPITILIDETSASAAEILAGAIQDNDRGTIVGRRSFGKGLVQKQFDYEDGSAARITIARYYTPVGRSIQKPYKLGQSDDYFMELINRSEHSELFNVDSIKQDKSLRFTTPQGRVVYGGGGIMPDEFVPLDTTAVSPLFRKMFAKNIIFRFASQFTDSNRAAINRVTAFGDLDKMFAQHNLYNELINFAAANGIDTSGAATDKSRSLIVAQIKGYIGRNTTLEESAFFYYFYPEDTTIMKALKDLR